MRFSTTPKQLSDFEAQCHYNQTSPHSNFTKRELATIATKEGRVTFSDHKLIRTHLHGKDESPVREDKKSDILRKYFGIDLV